VLALIGDDFLESGDAWFVAKSLELSAVLRYVSAFIDFQAPKRQIGATDSVRE
jgi:hypothetical protein